MNYQLDRAGSLLYTAEIRLHTLSEHNTMEEANFFAIACIVFAYDEPKAQIVWHPTRDVGFGGLSSTKANLVAAWRNLLL